MAGQGRKGKSEKDGGRETGKGRVQKMAEGRQEREECKRWRKGEPAEKGAKTVFPKFRLPAKRKPPATQVAGGRS